MAYQGFVNSLKSLKISPSTPVGVAVSGGCDSVALAILAKEYFKNRIVGITVDHQLRPDSTKEALKVKALVESHSLEHRLLTVQWPSGETPSSGKVQIEAREARYPLLLDECQRMNLSCLLLGHHYDDQMETFLMRLSRSSGMIGLAGMLPFFINHSYNCSVPLVRPLLAVRKDELKQFCVDNGSVWFEDPSNALASCQRNVIRDTLRNNPDIHEDMKHLLQLFQDAREICNRKVLSAIRTSAVVNEKYGYVTVNYNSYRNLSQPVARKFMETLIKFTSSKTQDSNVSPSTAVLTSIHCSIMKEAMNRNPVPTSQPPVHGTVHGTIVYKHDHKSFAVARRTHEKYSSYTPITIGQTIHWDNRFDVSLDYLVKDPTVRALAKRHSFYVRHAVQADMKLGKEGIRKIKSMKLPHVHSRGALPVLVAEKEGVEKRWWPVVAIPFLSVINRDYGVTFKCSEFKPLLQIEDSH